MTIDKPLVCENSLPLLVLVQPELERVPFALVSETSFAKCPCTG